LRAPGCDHRAFQESSAVSLATAIAIYFIIWWVMLFAVLPWGVRSQEESGAVAPGTDPGAPVLHNVWKKLVWTTVASFVVFGLCAVIYRYRLVTIEGLARLVGFGS
jgi:predicted secreted protein